MKKYKFTYENSGVNINAADNFVKYIAKLNKKKCFNKKHIVLIHREKNTNDDLEKILNILMIRQYGRSKIIFGKFN